MDARFGTKATVYAHRTIDVLRTLKYYAESGSHSGWVGHHYGRIKEAKAKQERGKH